MLRFVFLMDTERADAGRIPLSGRILRVVRRRIIRNGVLAGLAAGRRHPLRWVVNDNRGLFADTQGCHARMSPG
jgi:hypothetical protein